MVKFHHCGYFSSKPDTFFCCCHDKRLKPALANAFLQYVLWLFDNFDIF